MVAYQKSIKLSDGETIQKFEEIKNFLGLKSDAETLRFLISWAIKRIKEEGACNV